MVSRADMLVRARVALRRWHDSVGTRTKQRSAMASAGGVGYGSGDSGFSPVTSTVVDGELAWSGGV
jgi:hypothetical protein